MRVAKAKGCDTLSALWEKTNVDRKTLRAINAGQQVKETTLQRIADKLRVPLAHLVGSQTADKGERGSVGEQSEYSEIKLQQLDAASLPKVFEGARMIKWFLQIDQMPIELEMLLDKLSDALKTRFAGPTRHQGTLQDQITRLRASTDIDKCIVELIERNLKVCGKAYVFWERHPELYDEQIAWVNYRSSIRVALSILPKQKADPTVTVHIGQQPPRQFDESELDGIAFVEVDDIRVWERAERRTNRRHRS
jgi:hypothetical protein